MSKATKSKRVIKVRDKFLFFIMPAIIIFIILIIVMAGILSEKMIQSLSEDALDSSLNNQADNITSWLEKNLENFSSVKQTIEATNPDEEELQEILDSFYGYNSYAKEGIYIGTSTGELYKASDSTKTSGNITSEDWYKDGLTRVNLNYGQTYTDYKGDSIISASGIINLNRDDLMVLAADLSLDQISIIVNSGVKMDNAYSFLVDTNDNTILAHPDTSLVSTNINSSSDKLLSGVAKKIDNQDYNKEEINNYLVSLTQIDGTDWVLVSYIKKDIVMSSIYVLIKKLAIIAVIAILLTSGVIIVIVNYLIKPISKISDGVTAMADGDFTISINSSSNDEIGIMSDKVEDFIVRMRDMLKNVALESDKLQDQSRTSDVVAKSMYEASEKQAKAMQNLNSTVDELAKAVNEIAINAQTLTEVVSDTRSNSAKANESMQESVEISKQGKTDMEKLSFAMTQIQKSIEELLLSINKVGDASEQITGIVGLIGEIAEETNLLSLNASIEAARAGEAGKGFAVVAGEIGKLAQNSADNAQNIAKLIEQIRNLISDVVTQANTSAENIQSNTVLIDTAVETFDKIYENIATSNNLVTDMINGVTKVDDVATNVAAISEEQAASADEILETSKQMVEQAENITRNSEDVAANSEELADTSEKLTSYVSKFKLESDDEE
ncbi:methyl-accepting chemotaxis protein [Lachnospira multipara]|uniref:Methyl-accepting chemotaxis protein n=1 Tax=Lachnospira multipara TaxID=28051 RepID=A0A1H5V9Z8_9FIRM|nr:methyl-accepting chemotaxis protein [Lachnospira multipara]SEF84043.1 methyl-accepting chemotaxis protein [Lachnospira multipara]